MPEQPAATAGDILPIRTVAERTRCEGVRAALTVRQLVDLYLHHARADQVHCPQVRGYRVRTLTEFAATFGESVVSELRAYHLIDWVDSHPTWQSSSTRRSNANMVRACFNWGAITERTDRNPFAFVRYREAERRPAMPDTSLDEILSLAIEPVQVAMRFLRLTGARLSELCRATWRDVDLRKGMWTIHQHKTRRSTGKPKMVALVRDAVKLLRQVARAPATRAKRVLAVEAGRTHGPIFRNSRGTPWTPHTLGEYLRKLKRRNGIKEPATLHGLRHQLATECIGNGAPVKLISHQLGHTRVSTTEGYYCHLGIQHLEAIKAAVELGVPKKRK